MEIFNDIFIIILVGDEAEREEIDGGFCVFDDICGLE